MVYLREMHPNSLFTTFYNSSHNDIFLGICIFRHSIFGGSNSGAIIPALVNIALINVDIVFSEKKKGMVMRRRCLLSAIVCVLLILLFINAIFYFLVDSGLFLSSSPEILSITNGPKVALVLSPLGEKKSEAAKISRQVQKQRKFYSAAGPDQIVASIKAEKSIRAVAAHLGKEYSNVSSSYLLVLSSLLTDLTPSEGNAPDLWKVARKWVNGSEIVPEAAPLLGSILNTLCSTKIIKADNSKKGTQLKLALTLEGGEQALFKPQWYKREEVITGPVYAGKDRHNAEVAAFHLSLLLGLRKVPLTVGRKIDLRREVMPVATSYLRETFYQEGNNTCFYGICMYCSSSDPVCAHQDIMEGALILWLPSDFHFARYAHPWQRSYRSNLVARWEVEEDYCDKVKKSKVYGLDRYSRLLDLIDASIFDFLIDNGDRHHYEAPLNLDHAHVFLFDNGKSFGDPTRDHIDILAPLYQCCILREETWKSLLTFRGGALSSSLQQILRLSHIAPVLTNPHLLALDRRLLLVFAAVEVCFREKGKIKVLT